MTGSATEHEEWFEETLYSAHWRQRLKVTRTLARGETAWQKIWLFENPSWGKVLVLDDALQLTTGDEFAYHEMLAHPPILAHGRARHVAIVGGGDGGTLREVCRHEGVERVTMMELDPDVIAFAKQHLPEVSAGAFDDPRVELVIGDAARSMAEDGPGFDVIIVDSTDCFGPGEVLFGETFYAACRRRLNPGGILVTQLGNPAIDGFVLEKALVNQARAGFADVRIYLTVVPTYIGGHLAVGWACDDKAVYDVPLDVLRERPVPAGLRYYSPEIHAAARVLPPWLAELVARSLAGARVSSDPASASAG